MEEGEKKIRQEDCHEDSLGAGILTLTIKRVAFDKTRARIMDFSRHMGDTVIDAPLSDIKKVWKEGLLMEKTYVCGTSRRPSLYRRLKEGLLMKKVCIAIGSGDSAKTYKFGVLSPVSWADAIQDAIDEA